jgi:hypothetical protein
MDVHHVYVFFAEFFLHVFNQMVAFPSVSLDLYRPASPAIPPTWYPGNPTEGWINLLRPSNDNHPHIFVQRSIPFDDRQTPTISPPTISPSPILASPTQPSQPATYNADLIQPSITSPSVPLDVLCPPSNSVTTGISEVNCMLRPLTCNAVERGLTPITCNSSDYLKSIPSRQG